VLVEQAHAQADRAQQAERLASPPAPTFAEARIGRTVADTQVDELITFADTHPIAFVGIECLSQSGGMPVALGNGHIWTDIRTVRPVALAITLVENAKHDQTIDTTPRLHTFVFDARVLDSLSLLEPILRRPLCFAMPSAKAVLPPLWQLGLPAPDNLWDCELAERALSLGVIHPRYLGFGADRDIALEERRDAEALKDAHVSLAATCGRHRVDLPFIGSESRLQELLERQQAVQPLTADLRNAVAARSRAAARLYWAQVNAALLSNCLDHLKKVEMPWAVVCARMSWDGVRLDHQAGKRVLRAAAEHNRRFAEEMRTDNISDPFARADLQATFDRLGLLELFPRSSDGYSFEDSHLETAEGRHDVIRRVRRWRRVRRMLTDPTLRPGLVGADGRVHPEYRPLGAETGRTTMRWPNVGGVGRALRPLVIPADGYGIGEVDLCQIEVMIAAAVHHDEDLIRLANNSDVYSAMAQRLYARDLPPEAKEMPTDEFKRSFGMYRNRVKAVVLGILYGMTPHGLAIRLGVNEKQAEEEINRFLQQFPMLARGLEEAVSVGAARGYAEVCSGLRRHRGREGSLIRWEQNWLRNTPVQGSAAVAFKTAGVRLYRQYQRYGARLLLPMHDAVVFEAPMNHLEEVALLTAEALTGAVREYYPELMPRADINIGYPHCWNKNGKHDSLERWIKDPEEGQRYLES
jgi:DNA polymerase-1